MQNVIVPSLVLNISLKDATECMFLKVQGLLRRRDSLAIVCSV